MSHKGFVAAIFRVPGRRGGFKAPRSLSTRTAVPAVTSSSNLRSYFRAWGRSFTKFLTSEQGIPRVVFNQQLKASLRPYGARLVSSTPDAATESSPYGTESVAMQPSGSLKRTARLQKPKKVTIRTLQSKYQKGEKLSMLTAYDYPSARVTARAAVDMILVGDSLGMVVLGRDGTADVTMDEMLHHCKAAVRGAGSTGPWMIGDMPFGSYLTTSDAVHNAARFVKETGVDAVKLEGGRRVAEHVKAIVDCGVSVVAHIGLTPQSQAALGGFTVQGRSVKAALELLEDALVLQEAGACMLVMEMVPRQLAAHITQRLKIPTIGIGSGAGTSGQVLVHHDVLGVYDKFKPKFSKEFAKLGPVMESALTQFREEVETGMFPTTEHDWSMSEENLQEFIRRAGPPASAFKLQQITKPHRSNRPQVTGSAFRMQVCHKTTEPVLEALTHSVVIGAGSLGSLLASSLSRSMSVSVLTGWDRQRRAISTRGIQVSGLRQWHSPLIPASAEPDSLGFLATDQPVVVFVAVKGEAATRKAAHQAKAILDRAPKGGFVVSMQNGVGHIEVLEDVLGKGRVLAAVTYLGARTDGAGSLVFTGNGETILLPDSPSKQTLAAAVCDTFRANQLQCTVSPSPAHAVSPLVWEKLMVNACVNALTALVQIPNGGLADLTTSDTLMIKVAAEAIAVARARGLFTSDDITPNAIVSKAKLVLQQTAANYSSMLMDVRQGRPSEIDHINGYIVHAGKQAGIPTPVNETLAALVRTIDEKNASTTAPGTETTPQLLETIADMRKLRASWQHESVGFVPTMGALHDGHLALVKESLKHNDRTVVSIFVNPMQFAPHEDFDKYPRTFRTDLDKLTAMGVDAVFLPTRKALYPHSGDRQGSAACNTVVTVTSVEGSVAEALSRPGFFQGVATIVAKLFHIVAPSRAYFGQKDATQCAVIRQMVADLNMPTHVVVCKTHREHDGLAMSSRNAYLTREEREAAPLVFKSLLAVQDAFRQGERSVENLRSICFDALQHPLVQDVEYCSFSMFVSGKEIEDLLPQPTSAVASPDDPHQVAVAVALRMRDSGCRLIDNILL